MVITKVFIDFDDTLFDRNRFIHDYFQLLSEITGASLSEIDAAYHDKGVYDKGFCGPGKHLSKLAEKFLFDESRASEVLEHFLADTSSYLFPGAKKFLKVLADNFKIILLTVGNPEFQEQKVSGSGILKFFDDVQYIPPDSYKARHIKEMIKRGELFYLIDDKEAEYLELAKIFNENIAKASYIRVISGNYLSVYDTLIPKIRNNVNLGAV